MLLFFKRKETFIDQFLSESFEHITNVFTVEGVVHDERLVGSGGGEERRGGGRGRSRHHLPGRPSVPRTSGPHPESR